MKNLVLLGGGGHCRSVIEAIESLEEYQIIGVIDTPENVGKNCSGYEIIGTDKDLQKVRERCPLALVTVGQIGSPEARIRLFDLAKAAGFSLPIIVAKGARVSKRATLGEGTVVLNGATVNSGAEVGINAIINSHALIEHDARVGGHCHVSTGAILNGGAILGDMSFLGSGAVVREQIKIGSGVVIAMAAKVFKNVSDGERVM
jgi:sugar O-acyltransferase (sialic acid O-acetyltransferase NeuD family)